MNSRHAVLLSIAALIGFLHPAHAAASDDSDLHRSLLGAWVLLGEPGAEDEPVPNAEMKFWGMRHFVVTKRDGRGQIEYHHVGTYTLEGDQYAETVTHSYGGANMVGQTYKFRIEVEGDTYLQYGIGNPWTQKWKRLGLAKKTQTR